MIIFVILTLLTFILPFLTVSPLWALVSIGVSFLILPTLAILPGIILKPLTRSGLITAGTRDIIMGVYDGIVIILLSYINIFPNQFSLAVILVTITNLLNRYIRNKNQDELYELIGLTMFGIPAVLIKLLFK